MDVGAVCLAAKAPALLASPVALVSASLPPGHLALVGARARRASARAPQAAQQVRSSPAPAAAQPRQCQGLQAPAAAGLPRRASTTGAAPWAAAAGAPALGGGSCGSATVGRGGAGAAGLRRLGTLEVPPAEFDLARHVLEVARLLSPGRAPADPVARPIGVAGGVWMVSAGPSGENLWVVKSASVRDRKVNLPSDSEHCDALLRAFPCLASDARLAFPHSLVRLESGGEHAGDLLVARAAPGVQLGEHIAKLSRGSASDQLRLERVCAEAGALLADFHVRYADPASGELTHHRDFHPSNVLYHEETGSMCMVDLAGMGSWGPKDDVEKFSRCLAQMGGARLAGAFAASYQALLRRRAPAPALRPARPERGPAPLFGPGAVQPAGPASTLPLFGHRAQPSSGAFRHLGSLVLPAAGFNPAAHLTSLVWMLSPGAPPPSASVRPSGSAKSWVLSEGAAPRWALKQVSLQRCGAESATAAEHCEGLAARAPRSLRGGRLALPCAVVPLHSDGAHVGDVLVSDALQGEALSGLLPRLAPPRAEELCARTGELLAELHAALAGPEAVRFDGFHPRHVLYDEASGSLGLVGLHRLGRQGDLLDDVGSFAGAVEEAAGAAPAAAFRRGYAAWARPGGCSTSPAGDSQGSSADVPVTPRLLAQPARPGGGADCAPQAPCTVS